jgi:PhnB protein
MDLTPQIGLHFDGRCESALRLYERCFHAKVKFMLRWSQSPMAGDAPPEWQEKIFHASLAIGDTTIAAADVLPAQYHSPQGFSIVLNLKDPDEADRLFAALSENGTVRMPLQETFWALRFASVIDQFGIPWDINCERPG